jgi:hypothetical protein
MKEILTFSKTKESLTIEHLQNLLRSSYKVIDGFKPFTTNNTKFILIEDHHFLNAIWEEAFFRISNNKELQVLPIIAITEDKKNIPAQIRGQIDYIATAQEFLDLNLEQFVIYFENFKDVEATIYKTILTTFNHKINNTLFKSFYRIQKLEKKLEDDKDLTTLKKDLHEIATFLKQMTNLKDYRKELYSHDCYMLIDHENFQVPKSQVQVIDEILLNKKQRFDNVGLVLKKLNGEVIYQSLEDDLKLFEQKPQDEKMVDLEVIKNLEQDGQYRQVIKKSDGEQINNYVSSYYLLNSGSDKIILNIITNTGASA